MNRIVCIIAVVMSAALHSNGEEMLILTVSEFYGHAVRLASLHSDCDGLKVAVTDIESECLENRDEIKSFVNRRFEQSGGALRYLLLYGDGLIPVAEAEDRNGEVYYSDAYYGLSDDGERLAVTVGRIPCRTVNDAEAYNRKIERYLKKRNVAPDVLVISDRGDGNEHLRNSETIAGMIENAHVHKVYNDLYARNNGNANLAREALKSALDRGIGLWIYSGHGDEESVTHDNLWTVSDAGLVTYNELPVSFFNACEVGKFSFSTPTLSQTMLFNADGGSVAVMASSKKSMTSFNHSLAMNVVRAWNERDHTTRWGDIWLSAVNRCLKNASATSNVNYADNTLAYNFIGDPALPAYVTAESGIETVVNGGEDSELSFIAGEMNRLHCEVAASGKLTMRVYGAPCRRKIPGYDREVETDDNLVFETRHRVDVAECDIEFILAPAAESETDIRIELAFESPSGNAREVISGRLLSDDMADFSHVPEIKISGMSMDVQDNGSAMLRASVDHGVHGHEVTDGVVGNRTTVSVDGVKTGRRVRSDEFSEDVVYDLGHMTVGNHIVELQVADNYGRTVSETIGFEVSDEDCRVDVTLLSDVARESLGIRIETNCRESLTGTLIVKGIDGKTYMSRRFTGGESEIDWNLRDMNGEMVADGMYECFAIYSAVMPGYPRTYASTGKLRFVIIR